MEAGLSEQVKMTQVSTGRQHHLNMSRLMELCLEKGRPGFSNEDYVEYEPHVRVETQRGPLVIGKGKEDFPPHLKWRSIQALFSRGDKQYVQDVIETIVVFTGEVINSEKVMQDDLTSCEDMLYYMLKIFEKEKE